MPDATGLKPSSALLVRRNETLMVNGAQGMFETRLGAGLSYRVTPELALFVVAGDRTAARRSSTSTPTSPASRWLFGGAYRF